MTSTFPKGLVNEPHLTRLEKTSWKMQHLNSVHTCEELVKSEVFYELCHQGGSIFYSNGDSHIYCISRGWAED